MKTKEYYSGGVDTITRSSLTQLFNEIFHAEKTLRSIFEENIDSVLVTNIKVTTPSIYSCYCLIIENGSIEYIEKFSNRKVILRYDLTTMSLYKNDQIQDTNQVRVFMTKLDTVKKDLASNQAFIYENKT